MKNEELVTRIAELEAQVAELESQIAATKKSKKPGVISHIVDCVVNAGKAGVDKNEVWESLKAAFPERDQISMLSTVNVQLPGRISNEKFALETFEVDGKKRYRKAGLE
jgi:hypothetical protein